jgi:hypothetical protein
MTIHRQLTPSSHKIQADSKPSLIGHAQEQCSVLEVDVVCVLRDEPVDPAIGPNGRQSSQALGEVTVKQRAQHRV